MSPLFVPNYPGRDAADNAVPSRGTGSIQRSIGGIPPGGLGEPSENARLRNIGDTRIWSFGISILRILFGAQAVKPDLHIRRFVSEGVGRPVQDVQTLVC
jgi:hypothetical protein